MKKYEKDLLFGTFMTLAGVMFLVWMKIYFLLCLGIIIIGKLIVIFSIMEYIDCNRAFKGEDLGSDSKFNKIIRKVRKTRYT